MFGLANRVFVRLPYPLRVAAASAKGYRLRQQRYGPAFERQVQECLERDQWSTAWWHRWQQERLSPILCKAANTVPYYREMWAERRRRGDNSPVDRLESWPVLEKEDVRSHARQFLANASDPARLLHEITSGTTGKPCDIWYSRDTVRAWYALHEARVRRGCGLTHGDRWALLAGKQVAPLSSDKPPFWVWNRGLNQLYLSSYHATAANAAHYANALRDHRVRYLIGYPSSLCSLAKGMERHGLRVPGLEFVFTQSEQLYQFQRQLLERVFQCPVRDTYGMSEMCAGAHECPRGSLHLWPEAGQVEVFENGLPVPDGEQGDLVCTGLLNPDMPLIRYRIGDRGWLAPRDRPCACGSNLPVLGGVQGRISDSFLAPNGRVLSPNSMEAVFDRPLPLVEGQLIQETMTRVKVVYVPDRGFGAVHKRTIEGGIRELMGSVEVTFSAVERLPRGPNGKVRVVVSSIA